jgi:hypothetical protein
VCGLKQGFARGGIECLGVADVGAVEEAEEVDTGGEWDDAKVLFEDEGANGDRIEVGDILVDVLKLVLRCCVRCG